MLFELQPTLQGRHLSLRPLHVDDFDELLAVASDPLIWEQHPSSDRFKPDVFSEFFKGAMDSGGALSVIDLADGKVIGSSRFYLYPERGEVEIGWTFLARSHWGGVYNGEMKDLMLRHAFRFTDRVLFLIGENNFRSQKAVEKIGGVLTDELPPRETDNRLVFEILRESYLQRV